MKYQHPYLGLLSSYSREFQSQVRRIRSFTSHSTSIGTSHEGILRRFLQRYIPGKLGVGEGFVVDKNGNASGQCDIIIWSQLDRSPYIRDGDFIIVPADAVLAVVEVKTSLNKESMLSSFKQLASVRILNEEIYTAVFAFESTNLETLLENIGYEVDPLFAEAVDSIYAMGDWVLQRFGVVDPPDPDTPPGLAIAASPVTLRQDGYDEYVPFALAYPPTQQEGYSLAVFLGFLFNNLEPQTSQEHFDNPFGLFPDIRLLFFGLVPGEAQLLEEDGRDEFDEWFQSMLVTVRDFYPVRYDEEIEYYETALANYDHIARRSEDFAHAYVHRGMERVSMGKYDEALADFQQALDLKDDYPEAYLGRQHVHYQRGEYVMALADCEKAINLRPDFADAYFNRGMVHNARGDRELALSDLEMAITLKPDFGRAYASRGDIYYRDGNYNLAQDDFQRAIVHDPTLVDAYYGLGLTLIHAGKLREAISALDTVISMEPKNAVAHTQRGTAYLYGNEQDRASQDYQKALELDPMQARAHNGLGSIALISGNVNDAFNHFDQAIGIDPNNADSYYNRGMVHMEAGNTNLALHDFKKALSLADNADLRQLIASGIQSLLEEEE